MLHGKKGPQYGLDAKGKKIILNKDNLIYQLPSQIDTFIRESYTGGACDVYIPWYKKILSNMPSLYYYDLNSLYPYAMKKFDMPVGLPRVFEGDITQIDPQAFGFFRCEITSPDFLDHPILQRRIRTQSGLRTIAGLGSWIGIIHSEEMNNAKKYGYSFKVLGGVCFNRSNIFNKFVTDLYNMRRSYPKTDPMNLICKLILNSLYGKFGQSLVHDTLVIYDVSDPRKSEEVQSLIDNKVSSIKD